MSPYARRIQRTVTEMAAAMAEGKREAEMPIALGNLESGTLRVVAHNDMLNHPADLGRSEDEVSRFAARDWQYVTLRVEYRHNKSGITVAVEREAVEWGLKANSVDRAADLRWVMTLLIRSLAERVASFRGEHVQAELLDAAGEW